MRQKGQRRSPNSTDISILVQESSNSKKQGKKSPKLEDIIQSATSSPEKDHSSAKQIISQAEIGESIELYSQIVKNENSTDQVVHREKDSMIDEGVHYDT